MDSSSRQHAGVKVTYIETQFVTSDAAGFKDLVQRLTGKSPTATAGSGGAAVAPHRPRASRAASSGAAMTTTAAAGSAAGAPQGYHHYRPATTGEVMRYPAVASSRAPQCQQEELLLGMDVDFSDLFYVGAIDQRRHGLINNGAYGDFVHY